MTDTKPTIEFKEYRRKQIAELADWHEGFDMTSVYVCYADKQAGSPKIGDKISRNPKNHADRWLVAAAYFADNFEPVRELAAIKSQPVPVEPDVLRLRNGFFCNPDGSNTPTYGQYVKKDDYDSLQSELQMAQQERDGYLDLYRNCAEIASDQIELAEKAEAENKQLVELLKTLLGALKHPVPPTQKQWDAIGVVSDNILLEMGK